MATAYFSRLPSMSRVRVRVTDEVVFFTIFCPIEVLLLVFLPLTASLTAVPAAVARVAVTAVRAALSSLLPKPLFFEALGAAGALGAACGAGACWVLGALGATGIDSSASLMSCSKALSRSTMVSYLP